MKRIVLLFILMTFILNAKDWGEDLEGIVRKIDTKNKTIFLTLDACGSKTDSYDEKLINFLIENNIKATLFISGRWIKKFPDKVKYLNSLEIFDIQNHGLEHRPCSVDGKSAYGIKGTESVKAMINEVDGNRRLIEEIIGKDTVFYRSGTAYYDSESVDIINNSLNIKIIGYSVLGDAGATFSKEETYKHVIRAKSGDIIIAHMNRPEKESSLGLMKALEELKNNDYSFSLLIDYIY